MKMLELAEDMNKFEIPSLARKHLVQLLVQHTLVCQSVDANVLASIETFRSEIHPDANIVVNQVYAITNCTTVAFSQDGIVNFASFHNRVSAASLGPKISISSNTISFISSHSNSSMMMYQNPEDEIEDISTNVFDPNKSVLQHTQEEMFNIVLGWNGYWGGFYAAAAAHEYQRISHLFHGEMGISLSVLDNDVHMRVLIEMLWDKAEPELREKIKRVLVQYRPLLPEISEYIPE